MAEAAGSGLGREPQVPSAARLFVAGTATLAALVVFAFWPGYFSRSPGEIDAYTHFHAAMAALWLALLLVQPILVASRRLDGHRRLGRCAGLLAPAFVASAVLLAHFRFAGMDDSTFATEAHTLYLPLSAALLFGLSFGLAMACRRQVMLHARFMACTALPLVDPVVGRVLGFYVLQLPQFWHYQLITFGIEGAVLLVLTRSLAPGSAARRAFAAFAAVYAAVLLVWFVGVRTSPWLAFAEWFRRLPLT